MIALNFPIDERLANLGLPRIPAHEEVGIIKIDECGLAKLIAEKTIIGEEYLMHDFITEDITIHVELSYYWYETAAPEYETGFTGRSEAQVVLTDFVAYYEGDRINHTIDEEEFIKFLENEIN